MMSLAYGQVQKNQNKIPKIKTILQNIGNIKSSSIMFLSMLLLQFFNLYAQEKELTIKDYGFQINDHFIPFELPYGNESLKTVELKNKIYPNKKYQVGFWVTAGKSPKYKAYTYYFDLFPSQYINKFGIQDKKLSRSEDIIPKVFVSEFQNYEKKYLSFIISPDTTYSYLTIGLDRKGDNFSSMKKYVKISGIFVQPLHDKKTKTGEDVYTRNLVDKGETFTIKQEKITILVYDHMRIDNDIVTLFLNEDILVKNLKLKKKKKKFKAVLKPGKNTIRLHAENLGKIPANTVAIIIKHGDKEMMQVLNSDLDTSEYFTLIYEDSKLKDAGN